jgi:sulfonate transport system permease protein
MKENQIVQRVKDIVYYFILPIILVIIWQMAANAGKLNVHILPSPVEELRILKNLLVTGTLQTHLVVSFGRVIKGFIIGTLAGLIVGSAMGLSVTANKLLRSLVSILRPIPMVAWIPLLILWVGIGEASKITVIIIGTFWPVLVSTTQGIIGVDKKLVDVAKIFEKSQAEIIFRVIYPAAMPAIFSGIRLGISSAWTCVVTAEMIAASQGIGFYITYARQLTKTGEVLVCVFSIGFIGVLIDEIIRFLEKKLLRWSNPSKE